MRLSYDNLLLRLAQDYNNVLLHHTSFCSNCSHQNCSSFIEQKKRKQEEESKEDELREIEELIVVVLSLQNKQRRLDYFPETSQQSRKGWTYEKNDLYFTDPETSVRSKMTYCHSLWYQNYIINPQPQKRWWCKLFCLRFCLPYQSFLDLVELCKESKILIQWADNKKKRCNPKQGDPIELLVLCALRYLGRAWTLCDLHKSVVINRETI